MRGKGRSGQLHVVWFQGFRWRDWLTDVLRRETPTEGKITPKSIRGAFVTIDGVTSNETSYLSGSIHYGSLSCIQKGFRIPSETSGFMKPMND